MTTMLDLVADAKRMAYGTLPESMNLVGVAAAAGATSITLQSPLEGITPGSLVSSGLNVWYVKGVTPVGNILSVIPGVHGSPPSPVAVDDFVYIKPRVTDWFVFKTVADTIRAMSSPLNGLYKVGSWTDSVDVQRMTYTIPPAALSMTGLLRVRALYPGSVDQWQDIATNLVRLQLDNATVRLLAGVVSNSTMQFLYKAPFTVPTALSDDVEDVCGLSDTMVDIPPLGAVATLLRTTESRRNQLHMQGDPRRSEEVQAGSNLTSANYYQRAFKDRIDEEYSRLVAQTSVHRGI